MTFQVSPIHSQTPLQTSPPQQRVGETNAIWFNVALTTTERQLLMEETTPLALTEGTSLRVSPYPTLRELIKENGNMSGLRSVSRRDIERVAPLEKYCGNLPTLLYPSGTPSGEREPLRGTGTSSDFAACPEGTLNGYSARRASPNSICSWGRPRHLLQPRGHI